MSVNDSKKIFNGALVLIYIVKEIFFCKFIMDI